MVFCIMLLTSDSEVYQAINCAISWVCLLFSDSIVLIEMCYLSLAAGFLYYISNVPKQPVNTAALPYL